MDPRTADLSTLTFLFELLDILSDGTMYASSLVCILILFKVVWFPINLKCTLFGPYLTFVSLAIIPMI